jgi:hypothetical protein
LLNYFDSNYLWLILQEILCMDLNNDIVCLHVLSQIFQLYYSKDFFNRIHWQAEVALGVLGRLRPQIFSTFSTTRVVGCQPNPRRNPWYLFSEGESTSRHMVLSEGTTEKIPSDTTGIDPGTVRLIAQRLNHYTTPGPKKYVYTRQLSNKEGTLFPTIHHKITTNAEDKLKIYKTSIWPILSCGCKAWTMTQDIRKKPSNIWKKNTENL